MNYFPFVDVTGENSASIPAAAALGIIALYATGSDGIEATAAEIARFKNAGVGVVLIDQTPSLSVFAAGLADVADVEQGAGTVAAAGYRWRVAADQSASHLASPWSGWYSFTVS